MYMEVIASFLTVSLFYESIPYLVKKMKKMFL